MLELQPFTIIITMVNLLVLYLFLKKYLFGRVNEVVDQRAKLVEDNIAGAERQRAEAEKLKVDYESHLFEARHEADNIVANAKKRASDECERVLGEAKEDAHTIIVQAHAQGERERDELLRTARGEVVTLAMLAASKLAGKSLDSDSDREMIDNFLLEAGDN